MKRIDLAFEIMLAVLCGILTGCCLVSAVVCMAWWQMIFAIIGCAFTWVFVREINQDLQK